MSDRDAVNLIKNENAELNERIQALDTLLAGTKEELPGGLLGFLIWIIRFILSLFGIRFELEVKEKSSLLLDQLETEIQRDNT